MKNSGLRYLMGQGFKYFWNNKIMSITSVSVLATCLLIIGSFWLTYLNVQDNLKLISAENEIVVYTVAGLSDTQTASIGTKISQLENVASSVFVSKEEGLEIYKEQFPDQAELLTDMESDNPLSDAYHIQVKEISEFDETVEQLNRLDGVEKIRSRSDIAEKLDTIGTVITVISTFIMVLLLAVSLFILVNTIKLALFAYRKEISIMKYVGATDHFIRFPFIIDGVLMGLMAGLISFFAQKYLYAYMGETMSVLGNIITIFPFATVQKEVFLSFMLAGLGVGVLGSAITIKRYLDV